VSDESLQPPIISKTTNRMDKKKNFLTIKISSKFKILE